MKYIILVLLILTGCMKKQIEMLYRPPLNCTVTSQNNTAIITCPDGTTAMVSNGTNGTVGPAGPSGSTGNTGLNGSSGHSAAFSMVGASLTLCPAGGSVISLGIDLNDDSVLQLGETGQVAVLCNGVAGTNGTDGQAGANGQDAPPTPLTPVAIVNVCGDAPGIDDEVFLRLYNGLLLWSESDTMGGVNTRLSLARAGTWTSTDGDHCVFTLDSNLNITYENHHYL